MVQRPVRILGIFAHPDDETFCAGGTLAKYAVAGAEVLVVSATRGQAGQIRDSAAATRRTLGEVREQELRRAGRELGIQHVLCLDYDDGMVGQIDPEDLVGEIVRIICTFCPDVVITFDPSGVYGHPDHVAVSVATAEAFRQVRSGEHVQQPPEGAAWHPPESLYYSLLGHNRVLLVNELVHWLIGLGHDFRVDVEFVQAMSFFAKESSTLQFVSDYVDVNWYPPGTYIIEQGEVGDSLYLILSGTAEVIQENEEGECRSLGRKVAGQFFGELALAFSVPRTAHVIAVDGVTCLVLSRHHQSVWDGRGMGAQILSPSRVGGGEQLMEPTTCVDVSDYVDAKMAAIAAHRTQYPMRPDMFPRPLLVKMLGREYFIRVYPTVELETELYPLLDTTSDVVATAEAAG